METEDIKIKIEKVISNNNKLDEVISNLDKCVETLKKQRNSLKKEVTKLSEQTVIITRDLSNSEQLKTMLEQEIKVKSKEIMVIAKELEQLKWRNSWHGIIAENQTAELKTNYDRMEALHTKNKGVQNNSIYCNVNTKLENEIEQLKIENKALEEHTFLLKKSLSSPSTIDRTEKEISNLQNRNDKILKRMKCQLAQLEYRNAQDHTYLKSLQKEFDCSHSSTA